MTSTPKKEHTPDDNGFYPAFHDLFHGLTVVMEDAERESLEWSLHPWMDEIGVPLGDWDCDYSTWRKHFSDSLPPDAFRVDLQTPAAETDLPAGQQVVPLGGQWVVRDEKNWYWSGLVENGWR
jgi:hypothetical protein